MAPAPSALMSQSISIRQRRPCFPKALSSTGCLRRDSRSARRGRSGWWRATWMSSPWPSMDWDMSWPHWELQQLRSIFSSYCGSVIVWCLCLTEMRQAGELPHARWRPHCLLQANRIVLILHFCPRSMIPIVLCVPMVLKRFVIGHQRPCPCPPGCWR